MQTLPTLRGRDAEQAVIGEALDAALKGTGSVVLVEAPPGFGKTRLLAEATRMAEELGFALGTATALRADGMSPMATLVAALFADPDPLLDREALRGLELRPEARYWLLDEIEDLLERASRDRPLLIGLDDLHRADGTTLGALEALPRRLRASPVVWMMASRRGEAGPQLRGMAGRLEREGARRLGLQPLDDAAIRMVITDTVGAPSAELVEVALRSNGCPFLLLELLLGQREEGRVTIEKGFASLVKVGLPRRIADSMLRRLERLSPQAARTARVAAVLRDTFSVGELTAMLALPASALLDPVDELLRADLLVERGDRLGFRHDLLRDGVCDSLPASSLRELQRRAADLLLKEGAAPLEVATKLVAGAVPGDAEAVATLLSAAWAVAAADPGAAADLGHAALRLTAPGDAIRGDLIAASALWLHAAGRLEEGRALTDGALRESLSAADEGRVRLSIAGMFSLSPDARARIGRAALEIPGLPASLRAGHLARLLHNLVVAGRGDEADALAGEARAAAARTPSAELSFTLDLAAAARDYAADRFASANRNVARALAQDVGQAEDARWRLANQWQAEMLALADDFDGAFAVTRDGLRAAQREGRVWTVRTWESWRSRLLLQSGQVDDASAALQGLLGDGDELELENLAEASAGFAMGRVALHTGDARATRASAAFAERIYADSWPELKRHGAWLLALQAASRGEPRAARDVLMRGTDADTPILPMLAKDVTDEVRLVRIALAADDASLAGWAVAVADARAALNPGIASVAGTAAHAGGLARADAAMLAQAVAHFQRSPRRLALASALEDLGAAARAAEDQPAAIEAFGRALEIASAAGAAVDAQRLRRRLRALGVRRRIARSRGPKDGWAALTRSEAVVARLAADGLTNRDVADRLIVSQHTVSMHLRHAFAKLGINSRRELAPLVPDAAPPKRLHARVM